MSHAEKSKSPRRSRDKFMHYVVVILMMCTCCYCAAEQEPKLKDVFSQPSWVFSNDQVEVALTQYGGMMAPVQFYKDSNSPVQPYYINPWHNENIKIDLSLLRVLRGDFFCFPFGGNAEPYQGEKHDPHGETAGGMWHFKSLIKSGNVTSINLEMNTTVRKGTVYKTVSIVDGQNVLYVQHKLEKYNGPMCFGHHATLYVPEAEGSVKVSTSTIKFGMTCPVLFSDPAKGEYQSLAIGKKFDDLRHVPLLWKEPAQADCTSFPARKGFTDLLGVFSVSSKKLESRPAWTVAVNTEDGYLWFSLKNPDMLPTTLFWISNHGRHGSPWNGRNRCLGLEDVCGFFAEGLAASAKPNLLQNQGIKTAIELSPDKPTVISYVEGVVRVPKSFVRVKTLEFTGGSKIVFIAENGERVSTNVNYNYVYSGAVK